MTEYEEGIMENNVEVECPECGKKQEVEEGDYTLICLDCNAFIVVED